MGPSSPSHTPNTKHQGLHSIWVWALLWFEAHSVWGMAVKRHSRGTHNKARKRRSSDDGGTVHNGPRAWGVIRTHILERDHHQCQARDPGCTGEGTEVHHVIEQAFGGTDDDDNLITLCESCHHRKTLKFRQELARRNREAKKEAARRNVPGRRDRHDPL